MNQTLSLKTPAGCAELELADFEAALVAAGETASPALAGRIRHAECLACLRDAAGILRGCGALKRPKPEHRAALFKRAAAEVPPELFEIEIGWLAGEPDAIAVVVAALAQHAGDRPVYVLSRTDETGLHAVLADHGFRAAGQPWQSVRGEYFNQIHLRNLAGLTPDTGLASPS